MAYLVDSNHTMAYLVDSNHAMAHLWVIPCRWLAIALRALAPRASNRTRYRSPLARRAEAAGPWYERTWLATHQLAQRASAAVGLYASRGFAELAETAPWLSVEEAPPVFLRLQQPSLLPRHLTRSRWSCRFRRKFRPDSTTPAN